MVDVLQAYSFYSLDDNLSTFGVTTFQNVYVTCTDYVGGGLSVDKASCSGRGQAKKITKVNTQALLNGIE